jgi:hypothetical protein
MEPESGLAYPDGEGVVILYPTQCSHSDQVQFSEALGLPLKKVRIVQLLPALSEERIRFYSSNSLLWQRLRRVNPSRSHSREKNR